MPGSTSPPSPAALQAFLRGIERRAFVLAEAQCGDPALARAALAASCARLRHEAAALPLREWPLRFWAGLIARPELRDFRLPRRPLPGQAALAALSPGARAALLLRLAAGLDLPHVAAVLGVSESAARLALARAVRALGADDAGAGAALRVLDAALHARVRDLPEAERARLAELRERSLHGEVAAATGTPRQEPPPRLLRWLWGALALVTVLLLGTFLWPPAGESLAPGESRPLPEAAVPALSPESAALASPDFELLADPEGQALALDLAFYAWLAAQDGGADAR
ncbi:sigma factor-like helix-turn-helix DNA-binding protein [Rehaibacterium terrae]|jgi:hypothetical protein|uniref:RNA polymerase sigma factor 70 region 4 type 2 domain-containing protein n=1 Tax=Rehaibacterium terrae TaxID=1341696 RepID=A0A7W7V7M4_9GAMM|nr:sigma factor-like helix-turn-helix DNA-binding protein [Rehaibacterium terrae]MBB5014742.1 hypothetical protein [Rehaibacterium terrae]